MVSEAKATERPWRIARASQFVGTDINIIAEDSAYVCLAGKRGDPVAQADAELIVRAVNSHDDLLWFADQIIRGIESGNINIESPTSDETLANILKRGSAAITKAGAQ